MHVVVVGTGPAGITAAEMIRTVDPTCSVTALSNEPYAPYSPPAMADHFLTGRREPLFWKGDVADRLGIDERRGVLVEGIDADDREVSIAGSDPITYDKLLIASGSRLFGAPGMDVGGSGTPSRRSRRSTGLFGNAHRWRKSRAPRASPGEARQGAAQPRAGTCDRPTLDGPWAQMPPATMGTSQPLCGWPDCAPGPDRAPA